MRFTGPPPEKPFPTCQPLCSRGCKLRRPTHKMCCGKKHPVRLRHGRQEFLGDRGNTLTGFLHRVESFFADLHGFRNNADNKMAPKLASWKSTWAPETTSRIPCKLAFTFTAKAFVLKFRVQEMFGRHPGRMFGQTGWQPCFEKAKWSSR